MRMMITLYTVENEAPHVPKYFAVSRLYFN